MPQASTENLMPDSADHQPPGELTPPAQDSANPPQPPAPPPRFSWPMRIFLGFLLFDMVFQSFAVLLPIDTWCEALSVDDFPLRLPTTAQRLELAAQASDKAPDPVGDRVWESVDSVWDFLKPWPSKET